MKLSDSHVNDVALLRSRSPGNRVLPLGRLDREFRLDVSFNFRQNSKSMNMKMSAVSNQRFIKKDSRGLPDLVNQSHGENEGVNLAAEEDGRRGYRGG
jgi:hypothetical protein